MSKPARFARLPRTKQRERYLPLSFCQMIDVSKNGAKRRCKVLTLETVARFCNRIVRSTVGEPRVWCQKV
nr:putative integron gene cassette protein [uncultured bacterium]